jgi:starch synthase
MRILQVSAELFPLLKTGGLADIAGALPLRAAWPKDKTPACCCRAFRPSWPACKTTWRRWPSFTCALGRALQPARRATCAIDGAPTILPIYCDRRAGRCTTGPATLMKTHRRASPTATTTAASRCSAGPRRNWRRGSTRHWQPEVVHAHDWHAALAPAYLAFARQAGLNRDLPRVGSVFTVHNLAYQGIVRALASSPTWACRPAAFQHERARIPRAGFVHEGRPVLRRPAHHGEPDLRTARSRRPSRAAASTACCASAAARSSGILNAVDDKVWNPASDAAAGAGLSHALPPHRPARRAARQRAATPAWPRRAQPDAPLFILVSRLTEQKGLHLVLQGGIDVAARPKAASSRCWAAAKRGIEDRLPPARGGGARSRSASTIGYNEDARAPALRRRAT